ncbi:hypothetical protein [Sediminibacterium soli]|uniref:hypothetical protein n=1 Tax=Sediminibacterium soli TaxID=2698829 RepID=UPI00137A1C25|nr:hypothetical protein [Sediminibacterium soli]NCI45705.1 hypothetical protein [Sediminibacterium soli]
MKNSHWILTSLFLLCALVSFAQDTEPDDTKGQFKRERIYLGTGLNLGLSNRSFNVGVNPEIGYSITRWLDAGIGINFNYFSQNFVDFNNQVVEKRKSFTYGGGPYLRIWPLDFLHVQVQAEQNWISQSVKDVPSNISYKNNYNVGSLLLGIGYGSRVVGSRLSYITLMIDVLDNRNSPYRDFNNDPIPVFRAGFGFYLRPKR